VTEHPFSRSLPFAAIGSSGLVRQEVASDRERAAIAEALGILELRRLEAEMEIERKGEVVAISGRIRAEPVQACVATLVPVVQHIDEAFGRRVIRAAPAAQHKQAGEVVVSPDESEEDPPDMIAGDRIDLGEILVEELTLLLDPYPRAPGAEFASPRDVDDTAEDSPFAVLKTLGRGES
jgi:uncharacterized metal-binding protein YceD (DUF177 family)